MMRADVEQPDLAIIPVQESTFAFIMGRAQLVEVMLGKSFEVRGLSVRRHEVKVERQPRAGAATWGVGRPLRASRYGTAILWQSLAAPCGRAPV